MRCRHCQNIMDQTDQVLERHTRQTWYRCPVCDSQHTVSEPSEGLREQRTNHGQRIASSPQRGFGINPLHTA